MPVLDLRFYKVAGQKKEISAQVLSCEVCGIFINTCFDRTLESLLVKNLHIDCKIFLHLLIKVSSYAKYQFLIFFFSLKKCSKILARRMIKNCLKYIDTTVVYNMGALARFGPKKSNKKN